MTPTPSRKKLRIVCIADTHNHGPGEGFTLPKGDVLIHAGDLTNQGSLEELRKAVEWIGKAEFGVKIVVAGNHDLSLDPNYASSEAKGWNVAPDNTQEARKLLQGINGLVYLQHESTDIQLPGQDTILHIFGSPFSPDRRPDQNWAFQYPDEKADGLWNAIPDDTDILITHTPPAGYCDASEHWREGGCSSLATVVSKVKPALHICGHCHEGRGAQVIRWGEKPGEVEGVRTWQDPGIGNKKQSLLDLTGGRGSEPLETGKETAVVNASVMARSWGRGSKAFHKPIVVDVSVPIQKG